MYRGLPKKGAWTVFRFKRGSGEREGVVFLWGVVTQVQTMDFEQVNVRWVGRKRF